MGKKMKLNLGDLKVQSFVTSIENNEKNGIRGGEYETTTGIWFRCVALSDCCTGITDAHTCYC